VDPYYLTHKATVLGYHPELILSARRINSRMGLHVAYQVMRLMTHKRIHVLGSKILILGLTFKENCPDLRNTRVVDIVHELQSAHADIDVYDPNADAAEAKKHLHIDLVAAPQNNTYDAIILAVAHEQFVEMGVEAIRKLGKENCVIFDTKSVFDAGKVDGRL
ncbi:MAG: UDP binding domain-containing protein, partial [Arenimonas sp.]